MAPPTADLPAILEAAMEVFFRFGFKKASMDDVARAAGISRQGLYLKFSTKEQLFTAALEHLVSRLLKDVEETSSRAGLDVETRLMKIFDALHGDTGSSADTAELLHYARARHNDVVTRFEREFIEIVAALLIRAGVDKRWSAVGITATDLAEHLLLAASGIKARASGKREYEARMVVAIALVARGEGSRAASSERKARNTA